jgi:hypothetical protein
MAKALPIISMINSLSITRLDSKLKIREICFNKATPRKEGHLGLMLLK